MKTKGVRPQTPGRLSSNPSDPFLIACTVVDIENRWIINRIAAWFEEEKTLEEVGLSEDENAEFQRDNQKGATGIQGLQALRRSRT
jgi:signal recognition particle receptor subunit beta